MVVPGSTFLCVRKGCDKEKEYKKERLYHWFIFFLQSEAEERKSMTANIERNAE
jgi:hypothetical protein